MSQYEEKDTGNEEREMKPNNLGQTIIVKIAIGEPKSENNESGDENGQFCVYGTQINLQKFLANDKPKNSGKYVQKFKVAGS